MHNKEVQLISLKFYTCVHMFLTTLAADRGKKNANPTCHEMMRVEQVQGRRKLDLLGKAKTTPS